MLPIYGVDYHDKEKKVLLPLTACLKVLTKWYSVLRVRSIRINISKRKAAFHAQVLAPSLLSLFLVEPYIRLRAPFLQRFLQPLSGHLPALASQ